MSSDEKKPKPATRPETILADDNDPIEVGGVRMRKGTVAAFIRNAMLWCDPEISEADRADSECEIVGALPALRALGVLTVFEARDERLRALLAPSEPPLPV